MEAPLHGGDHSALRRLAQVPEGAWIDLSTGINPWAYPLPPLPAASWQRLPDRAAEQAFKQAARRYYGVAEAAGLAAAPGSQALIQCLPRLLQPCRVAVLGFTYAEHARAWTLAGHQVEAGVAAAAPENTDVVVLVNPNNPDGARRQPEELLALAASLESRGGLLVVDEAFADVAPELSLARFADRPGLVLLRSFGKFFGLAGLRLGVALGDPAVTGALAQALGPWAVPGPALEIATQAFADDDWIGRTRRELRESAAELDRQLARTGLTVLGGTDLYRLAAHPEAPHLFESLCRAGLLVRRFPERPEWLRFGLPPDAAATGRLTEALNEACLAS